MINQTEQLKKLKAILLDILGNTLEDSLNVLGTFEFIDNGIVIGTSPAIRIGFPLENEKPIYRMQKNSGIQCIINNQPDIIYVQQGARTYINKYIYAIYLDQYNPRGNLTDAVNAIIKMPRIVLNGQPIIMPEKIEADNGILPARAILYVNYFDVENMYY